MTLNKCPCFHIWMYVSSLLSPLNNEIFLPLRSDVQNRCSACSKSRTIKIHPEKSQSSDLEGKRSAPFRSSSPTSLSSVLKQQGCGLHISKWISCFLKDFFFSKSNRTSLLTYSLRESVLWRYCSEEKLNECVHFFIYWNMTIFWLGL